MYTPPSGTPDSDHPYPAFPTKVCHVGGTDYEIGRQHAEQVGNTVSKGMVKFYFDFWKRLLSTPPKGWFESAAFQAFGKLVDPVLVNRLVRQIPPILSDRARGVADVSGEQLEKFMTSLVLPDLLPILEVYSTRLRPGSVIDIIPPPRFGCTSFVSAGKNFLHGRNLDFPGVAYWDRYPVIQVTSPKYGLRSIGFTTAGSPICGITGVNEAQISVSLHQHYCARANLNGRLPFAISEELLAKARTLDEAIKILSVAKFASSWAFILTDGKTREAAIVEANPKTLGVKRLTPDTGVLAHSNYFQTTECRPDEFATTARMTWDNFARRNRLEDLVSQTNGNMDPAHAARILSDHFDPYWGEEKIINRTISQVYNIQSLILDSEKMVAYLAEGDAPVHLRAFGKYDLGELFAGRAGRTGETLPVYQFEDPKKRQNKLDYILSFVAAFDGRVDEALRLLSRTLQNELVPEAAQVAGVIRMKQGNFQSAALLLGEAKTFIEEKVKRLGKAAFPPEYFEILIFLARANDLIGKREEAVQLYKLVEHHIDLQDSHLKRIAARAPRYTMKKLSRIFMPYSSYVPFE